MLVLAGTILGVALGAGCSSSSSSSTRYAYSPIATTNATSAEIDGRPSAVVVIGAAQGELQLSSLGVERVTPPRELHLPEFRALYVRMSVLNASRETWIVDEALQRIEIEEHGAPVIHHAVTITGERPPTFEIEPGKSYWLDLMFPLGSHDAKDVPAFDVHWRIQTASSSQSREVFTGRVAFQRHLDSSETPLTAPTYHPPNPLPYRVPGRYPNPPPIY